jgi:competence protein ComEA
MSNPDAKTVPAQQTQPQGPQDGRRAGGALDLNTASEAQLAEIDMIGKKLAHAIVERRDAHGGFGSWDDLRNIDGLEPMKLAELQRAARLGPQAS